MAAEAIALDSGGSQVATAQFADRHLYSLPGKIDLAQGETRQVRLFEAEGVPVTKRYRLEGLVQVGRGPEEAGPLNPEIIIEIENSKEAGLGLALPGGTLRVYQPLNGDPGASGDSIFIGAATLKPTAEDEEVELSIGRAFDITGRSRLTDFQRISNTTGAYETSGEVEVSNARSDDVIVEVLAVLPRGWKMLDESQEHQSESANRIRWDLKVPANGKAKLAYRIRVAP